MNPVFQILLIALTCAAAIAGAILGASFYRRREAAAEEQRKAARVNRSSDAATPSHVRPQAARPVQHTYVPQEAPVRYAAPVQQPVHDTSGADLVNILLMQQALNSIADEQRYEEYREELAEERYESQEQSREYTPEPAAYEAPAASPEPAYTAPDPVSYAPDPTPSYDSSPSFDSSSYSDSGFSGGDSGSF